MLSARVNVRIPTLVDRVWAVVSLSRIRATVTGSALLSTHHYLFLYTSIYIFWGYLLF